MRSLSLTVLLAVLARPAAAQDPVVVDASTLARELGSDPQRDVEVLARLQSLGPRAAAVLPELLAMPWREDAVWRRAWVNTVGELAPYRAPSLELDVNKVMSRRGELEMDNPRRRLGARARRVESRGARPRAARAAPLTRFRGDAAPTDSAAPLRSGGPGR